MFYMDYFGEYWASRSPAVSEPSGAYVLIAALLFLIFRNFAKTVVLDLPLLRHACETLEVSNAGALEEVVQSSAAVPSYGEGTAEALDVGGF